jgi:hypothetical protein
VIFTNTSCQQVIVADEEAYEEQGCSQLLPSDVPWLRTYYVGQNTIVCLQYWCILVVAILLALQHDEFHLINHTSFIPVLFEITREQIDCLVLRIMGKTDKRYVTFRLNADNYGSRKSHMSQVLGC